MAQSDISAEVTLVFAIKRHITQLFKTFLEILEDTAKDHDEALLKLITSLPPEYKQYVSLADYLSEEKCIRLRKKVLSEGNDAIRSIEDEFKKYKVEFK